MLSSGTSETARPKYVRQSSKWVDLANRQNPTLAIHVTSAWTIEWTYAELLQYASIILAARGIAFLQWTSSIVYLNFTVIFLVLVSLGARRKAEQLGLRRTALLLCTVLFFITICLTTFLPVYRDEKAVRTDSPHITSNAPESLPSTFSAVQTRLDGQGWEASTNRRCSGEAQYQAREYPILDYAAQIHGLGRCKTNRLASRHS